MNYLQLLHGTDFISYGKSIFFCCNEMIYKLKIKLFNHRQRFFSELDDSLILILNDTTEK